MADRIYVSKKAAERIIPEIDNSNFLGLGKSCCERLALYMFAVSLGVAEGRRTPLDSKTDIVLESVINRDHFSKSEMFAVLIEQAINDNETSRIDDKDYAYIITQEYANTGFEILYEWMHNGQDDMDITYKLIANMNKQIKDITVKTE